MNYDLSNIDEKYKRIVEILLNHEDELSDGYYFYCGKSIYGNDINDAIDTVEKLVDIAKEILGEQ